MTHLQELDVLMELVQSKYRIFKDDVKFHANWDGEEACIQRSSIELMDALNMFRKSLAPIRESNAKPLCDIRLDKYCGIDDLAAIVEASSLPCDHSDAN